jgi:hypothetical protein
MAPWVRTAFIDFLPRYLFIQRPDPDPSSEDMPELASGESRIRRYFTELNTLFCISSTTHFYGYFSVLIF